MSAVSKGMVPELLFQALYFEPMPFNLATIALLKSDVDHYSD